MYKDLKKIFWWPKMKKDVAEFVYACLTCQKSKIEHHKPLGLMQPLSISYWKWDTISMDFVDGLLGTPKRFAGKYIKEFLKLHGIPSSIVSDRDPRFTSKFWEVSTLALQWKLLRRCMGEGVGPLCIALPLTLSNLHSFFHMSQLRKYIPDPSHVIESDKVEIKENLSFETLPLWIEDRKVKELRGKTISLIKVVWGGATGESATWEVES
ncbi:uncharacterized protein [Cicer arietinum]|uniref:uncharacterized protein n=1 Tax=Cicer arietinum TaxID=3827 RepID=UPI003CC571CD